MLHPMKLFTAPVLALLLVASIRSPVDAAEVGWRQITVVGGTREAEPTLVALYYPDYPQHHQPCKQSADGALQHHRRDPGAV